MNAATKSRVGETLLVTIHERQVLATCYAETDDGRVVQWRTEDGASSGTWWAKYWDLSRMRQGCGTREGGGS